MLRSAVPAMLFAGAAAAQAADLTPLESRWLRGALPVLQYAQAQRLPVDIVVQPQASAGQSPLALGYVEGRCKLVMSMRGNPAAEPLLQGVAPALADAVIETVVAHELGHCWRHVRGTWSAPAEDASRAALEATRREEAFADLVGLAWTQRQRPREYAAVHGWLLAQRHDPALPVHHHDTLHWLHQAAEGSAFDGALATPFEQAHALWLRAAPAQ